MSINHLFLLSLMLFNLAGCSSLNGMLGDDKSEGDYIKDTDTESETSYFESVFFNPVLELPPQEVDSSYAPRSIDEQMNDYLTNSDNEIKFDNVWDRIPTLFEFSNINNRRIQQQKKWFVNNKRHIEKISGRAAPFIYLITDAVEQHHVPGEIALLPFIESAFRPTAYSNMKAAGLWQFVPATGRHFGLQQNWWYDGRRDVHSSTHAALTYLQQLNKYYKGDWLLALAAYNAGAGNINKAVRKNRKAGKPIDYWSLDLPRETQKYIPKLIALAQVIKDYKKYNISLQPIENSPRLMLVNTQSQIELSVAAKLSTTNLKEIKSYNPGFRQWATAPDGPHHLLLPIDKASLFEQNLAMLSDRQRITLRQHKIRSGESLSVIAQKYNLSVSALKTANNLKSHRIRAGKHLKIPVSNIAKTSTIAVTQKTSNSQTYTVRRGDSFWKIAQRFNLQHRKLASLNGLSPEDTLSIGQVLILSKEKSTKSSSHSEKSSSREIANKAINYKVQHGDSLYVISKRFNVSINELKQWNGLNTKKYLQPGQELKVYIPLISQTI